MVAGYQADVDPDDFTPANIKVINSLLIIYNINNKKPKWIYIIILFKIQIRKDNTDLNKLENWSSIQNTTRPRPEGGEDEDSKSLQHVDGLSNVDIIKVM